MTCLSNGNTKLTHVVPGDVRECRDSPACDAPHTGTPTSMQQHRRNARHSATVLSPRSSSDTGKVCRSPLARIADRASRPPAIAGDFSVGGTLESRAKVERSTKCLPRKPVGQAGPHYRPTMATVADWHNSCSDPNATALPTGIVGPGRTDSICDEPS